MKELEPLLVGDCLGSLRMLSTGSANTCVTSPPYYGLRDYGVAGQIGLEETPAAYVARLVAVFAEVHRVLRDDGTLWLNLGDSYAGGGGGNYNKTGKTRANGCQVSNVRNRDEWLLAAGVKPKELIGIPWRVAFALQDFGWYLRQEIIWHKPNPMPESVTDRCTKAHEHIFLLSKSPRYYFDHEAIKEPVASSTIARLSQPTLKSQSGSNRVPGKTNGNMKAVGNRETRNRRSVWSVATKPFKGAHFATYPDTLIEPCILAGAPVGGTVLDPFMGSGTTAVVAERLGRQWVGCELNPTYADMALDRIAAARAKA
ncbi:MAG: site-specific DNA-methyltransferase [Xanthomonas perforans]|uniref:Methyltransferase n=1 Tax=Xanthomonas perforans TaxID=442694 RepID=A0A6P0FNX9_XANPE|nr:site-specific DNA-methyltransferase [Xanthomonas perforans]NEL78832.1 site-specific DNA-methyltransferase [Xanthomonas perforans]NEM12951.1 site-specific DNA-methyltransferase [Xanthomonas perforans]